jgi:hypothetical protein
MCMCIGDKSDVNFRQKKGKKKGEKEQSEL